MNGSDEQTELLRAIWSQMSDINRTLNNRIGETNARLDKLTSRVNENFGRVQRNLQNIDERLVALVGRDRRVEDLEVRLTRIEEHVGLTGR